MSLAVDTLMCIDPSVYLPVPATLCPIRLTNCISQLEPPLLLYRNHGYLADETEGSQAATLSTGDGLLLGQGGSGDNTVITSRAMTGTPEPFHT